MIITRPEVTNTRPGVARTRPEVARKRPDIARSRPQLVGLKIITRHDVNMEWRRELRGRETVGGS